MPRITALDKSGTGPFLVRCAHPASAFRTRGEIVGRPRRGAARYRSGDLPCRPQVRVTRRDEAIGFTQSARPS